MSELTPELAPQIVEACVANAEELAAALGRAFDGEFVVKPGGAEEHDPGEVAAGAGIVVVLEVGGKALAALIPQDSCLLPNWVAKPDPTGESKLSTLAQELSLLVVPEDVVADASRCVWIDDVAAAIDAAVPAEGVQAAPLEVAQGETLGECRLVWPLAKKGALFPTESDPDAAATEPATAADEAPTAAASDAQQAGWAGPPPRDYRDLPPHVVSALGVTVPVSVNLASKQASVDEVVKLGPGSIIAFDKSCDGLLEIAAADRAIAEGEAVKVGEKFGVRLKRMILPEERFRPMLPPSRGVG